METIYTTAPADYDWWYTKVEPDFLAVTKGSNPKVIRKVKIPRERIDAQVGRYQSGVHMVANQKEWDKLVAYSLVEVLS